MDRNNNSNKNVKLQINDRKQFKCLNIALNNQTGPLFENAIDAKTRFTFSKR